MTAPKILQKKINELKPLRSELETKYQKQLITELELDFWNKISYINGNETSMKDLKVISRSIDPWKW